MDRAAQFSPLGRQRLILLDCLGGNSPVTPGYFDPGSDTDIYAAFSDYAARLSQEWASESESDPIFKSLLAAARFLSGDIDAASVILDCLPTTAYRLDHGVGYCMVTHLHALSTALPLPADLSDSRRWLAGSAEQTALREWLAVHRDRLEWSEAEGVYRLS